MVTRARFTADLVSTINANTSSPANAVFISSGGDVTIANSITVGGNIPGFVQNTYLHATFAQNSAIAATFANKIQVGNADVSFVTKSTALASNTALVGLINDRLQVANADTTFVTKSVALSSNTALVSLINDRLQVANLTSKLAPYWPSANAIAYINTNAGSGDMTVNTSIFVASGGETSVEIPVTSNNNLLQVHLNGFALTRSIDWTANSTHVKNIEALAAGDIVQIHEYKVTPANTLNRSSGSGGAYVFGGTTSGYAAGGSGGNLGARNIIDKWSLSSSGNASDVGDLTVQRDGISGQSSKSNGYASGGRQVPGHNVIDKFPFSSDTNASDIADLTVGRGGLAGHSSSESGYASGGQVPTDPGPTSCNIIDKFPFSSDSNATDVGDLTQGRCNIAGSSSPTHGYSAGGRGPLPPPLGPNPNYITNFNIIEKFPFSSDSNATDVGDLIGIIQSGAGQSSSTHGYVSGGIEPSDPTPAMGQCRIQKYSFASDGNATSVGNLNECAYHAAGVSSTDDGYSAGGRFTPAFPPYQNAIQKFPFASDTNASDVGNLTVGRYGLAGQQV